MIAWKRAGTITVGNICGKLSGKRHKEMEEHEDGQAWPGTRGQRRFLIYAFIAVVIPVLFLYSPMPDKEDRQCGWYVDLPMGANLFINCDSKAFVNLAAEPSLLFEENQTRQSRPLYAVAGWAAGNALCAFKSEKSSQCYYYSFVIMNFVMIFAALMLFDFVSQKGGAAPATVLVLSLFLACNDITKAFTWSAHQQIFNILTPVLAIFATSRILDDKKGGMRPLLFFSAAAGVLMLLYGNFIPMFLAMAAAFIIKGRREGMAAGRTWAVSSLSLLFFAVPTVSWMAAVSLVTGSYYNREMASYRQFVWMFDRLGEGVPEFFAAMGGNTAEFVGTMLSIQVFPFIALFAVALGIKFLKGSEEETIARRTTSGTVLTSSMLVLLFYLLFYWLMGYYHYRLTFAIVPSLLVMTAIFLSRQGKRRITFVLCVLAAGWLLFHILKPSGSLM